MKYQIKNRFTAAVIFEAELASEFDVADDSVKLGAAVSLAVKSGANLTNADLIEADLTNADLNRADLTGASLTGADLTDVNLALANLTGASLTGANLTGADLFRTDLTEANLTWANLTSANLIGADLYGANLTGANLTGANLSRTNLYGANLYGADLTGANLIRANLRGANLTEANLDAFRQDLIAEILRLPNELEALRQAIIDGEIDGSTYSTGGCSCLAGTLAKARKIKNLEDFRGEDFESAGLVFHSDSSSPREIWFAMISPGDTPDKNPAAKMALEWVDEAIAIRNNIRSTAA